MKALRFLIFLCILQYGNVTYAQVHLTIDAPYLSSKDTLELRLWKDYIGFPYYNDHVVFTASNENGLYHFNFDIDDLHWMNLHLPYQRVKGSPSVGIMQRFLVAPDDSLHLQIIPQEIIKQSTLKYYDNGLLAIEGAWKIIANGRGSDKIIGKLLLDSLIYVNRQALKTGGNQAIRAMKDLSFAKLVEKISGLGDKSFSPHTSEARVLLVGQALGTVMERVSHDLRYENLAGAGVPYLDFVTFEGNKYSSDELRMLSRSPQFLEYLYTYFILKKKLLDKEGYASTVYDLIKEHISHPILKEKVTIRYMMSTFNQNPSADILKDVRFWMEDPLCLSLLDRMAGGVKGRQVDFLLPDSQGKTHDIANLKGKIVLIDFWYMACIPCRNYMKNVLSPLADHFKSDDRFQVITISTDDKSGFERAVAQNDFLPKYALHLYTAGMRFQHPVLKDLGVHAYPQPFLLDKRGKIIGTKNDLKDLDSIIDFVHQYLEK